MNKIVFPKDLYTDIRIEEKYDVWLNIQNGDIECDGDAANNGAMIRVFDGSMWYTASTNDLDHIQEELDQLVKLANPNPNIYSHPVVKKFEVNKDENLNFIGDEGATNISRSKWKALLDHYIEKCVDDSIPEINIWWAAVSGMYLKKTFISSKGAELIHDMQSVHLDFGYGFTVDGVTTYGSKSYQKLFYDDLLGHEEEILARRERSLDFAKHAVDVEAGEYTCILAPIVTAMFTHESFGHKSESDFMLNDKTLQEEWVMGKQVGAKQVSICDDGNLLNHGYTPYDDEGTKARETWLIKDGILTGRLHNANSAVTLEEELTGNSRAESYSFVPIVRMTNTYMQGGTDRVEDMIKGVENGIYVYEVSTGTGQSTFTMRPSLCYRIRDGKICEPLRANVINGSVFQALFDIDMVGDDFEIFDTYYCGKSGQSVIVSAGGPSIRVKKLTVN